MRLPDHLRSLRQVRTTPGGQRFGQKFCWRLEQSGGLTLKSLLTRTTFWREDARASESRTLQPVGEFSALDGLEVEQVWVWSSLRLVFDLGPPGNAGSYIDVTEFEFTDPEGVVHRLNIESDPVAAGVVLGVLHRRVTTASMDEWELTVGFDNGARLVCPPHHRWEAWQAQLPDAPRAIAHSPT
jgi:hypothetical protein